MLGYTSYSRDWSPGGGPQQLSVVTTVWGVTTATQSGPQGGNQGYTSHQGIPDKDVGLNTQFSTSYRLGTPNYGDGQGGMNTGPGGGGAVSGGESQYGGALSAAAMVAAATATATATASVVALQERQDMNSQFNQMHGMPHNVMGNQNYGGNFPNQRGHAPMGMNDPSGVTGNMGNMGMGMNNFNPINSMASMGNMPMNGSMHCNMMGPGPTMNKMGMQGPGSQVYPRRISPYPSPAMHMNQKRGGGVYPGPVPGPGPVPMQSGFSPNNSNQYSQGYGNTRSNVPSQYQNQSSMQSMGPGMQNMSSFVPGSVVRVAPGSPSGQDVGSMRGNMSYQHSPIPGNPTPPLTPAGLMPPYVSPNADVKPNFGDIKPPLMMQKDDELRLTFPVRDGIILPPFRLEHNLAVSNHVFQLKPTVHQTLVWRSDLELQLKCFHHEDRQMNTNWPASVQVSVNATPLSIDRGENKTSHKPLYLKDVCVPGRNTIQITVSACCCSHLFVLQLVHRPSVRSVLQSLLRKRLLTADHCIAKIKRNFSNNPTNSGGLSSDREAVEQTALKVSLKCPITFKRITLPARGHDCKHPQCFDLESYLQLNCERGSWRCPVCNKPAQLEGLEVDQYIWGILNTLNSPDVEDVTIDSTANWKPAKSQTQGIKQEEENEACGGNKKMNKAMSPGSTTLPTLNSWDNLNQAMSPYIPPDMNSIASGSMMAGMPPSYGNSPMSRGMSYDLVNSPLGNKYSNGGPLSHLSDSVNSLDPLNAMEKSLNEQMPSTPHTPHTPHTPVGTPHTPGGPPSVPPNDTSNHNTSGEVTNDHSTDLPSDLNFDPAAVIDGEGTGQEALNLLPDNVVDPMELLSYLDPPDLATPPSSGASSTGHTGVATNDDILALFE